MMTFIFMTNSTLKSCWASGIHGADCTLIKNCTDLNKQREWNCSWIPVRHYRKYWFWYYWWCCGSTLARWIGSRLGKWLAESWKIWNSRGQQWVLSKTGFEITKKFVHEFVHEKNRARFHDSCTIKKFGTKSCNRKIVHDFFGRKWILTYFFNKNGNFRGRKWQKRVKKTYRCGICE